MKLQASISLALLTLLSACMADPHAAGKTESITLPRGADLEVVAREWERAQHGVFLADSSAVAATLQDPIRDAEPDVALKRISVDLDRACIRRGQTLVLQRRFGAPDEEPGIELEEAQIVAKEAYRLSSPFAPPFGPLEYTRAQNTFVKSLTAEQQQRMQSRQGLPVQALPDDQRELWFKINLTQVYDNSERNLRRFKLLMEQWPTATMEDFRRPDQVSQELFRFADAGEPGGRGGVSISIPRDTGVGRTGKPQLVQLPPYGDLPSRLKIHVSIPIGEFTLGDLATRLSAQGVQVRIPTYATGRKLWAFSHEGRLGDVLDGLGVLYGWSAVTWKDGYELGFPSPAAATDALDLHLKLKRLVPPAIYHQAAALDAGEYGRFGRQWARILSEADRLGGKRWKSLRVTQFSAETQRRLANLAAVYQLGRWYNERGQSEQPVPWVMHPERCILYLSGPLGPGQHPSLRCEAALDNGKTASWLFGVGGAHRIRPGLPPEPIE